MKTLFKHILAQFLVILPFPLQHHTYIKYIMFIPIIYIACTARNTQISTPNSNTSILSGIVVAFTPHLATVHLS